MLSSDVFLQLDEVVFSYLHHSLVHGGCDLPSCGNYLIYHLEFSYQN